MNCKNVQQSLSAYLDQELPGSEMLRMRSHIHHCPMCQEELEVVRALKNLLASAPIVEPEEGFELRLKVRLAQEVVSEKRATLKLSTLACVSLAAAAMTFLVLPSVQPKVAAKPDIRPLVKSDAAWGIRADQAAFSGSDPLGGGRVILATDYGRR